MDYKTKLGLDKLKRELEDHEDLLFGIALGLAIIVGNVVLFWGVLKIYSEGIF